MYVDLNLKGKDFDSNYNLALEASKYGWNHVNFSYSQENFKDALLFKEELNNSLDDISTDYTLEIKSNNPNEIRKLVRKFRNEANCISVVGGDLKINRAVCENIQLDILSRPYFKRYDSGLNHILAKLAAENNIAVELSFNDILKSYLSNRAKILANWRDIYTLYRKFDFPLIISSKAESVFDIRSPRDIGSFLKITGLTDEEITRIFSHPQKILEFNRNRDNLILKGVQVVSK